ncbi:MAG TPA: flagellar biosynthesis anti-sigma factor FlgM [Planctomycetota bacterium]|jgi:anti-sigma28 factor (negative regulator of flagellin synthesis)|nr:flagellar biosynthesis anti-sigma factor FlgM [Planctomycetota bacterium]
MDIGKTDGVGGPGRIDGPNKISRVARASTPPKTGSTDKVDLSLKAGMISKAMSLPAVRMERVAEIKKLIEAGRFETDARLEWALHRFVSENL